MVNSQRQVVAMTDQFSLETNLQISCAGDNAIPKNPRAYYVDASTIKYKWDIPNCKIYDEPIHGFEYAVSFH